MGQIREDRSVTIKDLMVSILIIAIIFSCCFNYYLYSNSFHKSLITQYSNNSTLLEVDKNITRYITGLDNTLDVPFNQKEQSHMIDVKKLIIIEQVLTIILLLSFLAICVTGQFEFFKHIKISFFIMIIILLMVLLMSRAFDFIFTVFHKIFFPQGNWQFPADSLMIQTYQEQFFERFTFQIFLLSGIICTGFFILSEIIKNVILVRQPDNKDEEEKEKEE
ncbi:MAG: DUF1461 domain-containing protein [Candidatus Woesearchaeota archaeon]|jgi:integral membrane protein (TIGR01906 family)